MALVIWCVFLAVTSQASFTDELAAAAGDDWRAITHDPFTYEMADGSLSDDVLRAYLVQDHRFVNSFSQLLAAMCAACETIEDRTPGVQFLALILGRENTYFERSFVALGVSAEMRADVPDAPETTAFIALMRTAARSGSLPTMLAVLVAAEWSYLEWGDRADATRAPDLEFYHAEWIDLHAGEGFRAVVAYLRRLLDEAATTDAAKAEASSAFAAAVNCEKDFWAMARRVGEENQGELR